MDPCDQPEAASQWTYDRLSPGTEGRAEEAWRGGYASPHRGLGKSDVGHSTLDAYPVNVSISAVMRTPTERSATVVTAPGQMRRLTDERDDPRHASMHPENRPEWIDGTRCSPVSRTTRARFVRFGLVGMSGILVNGAILLLAKEIVGLHYLLAGFLSTQVSILWNFGLSERWVFSERADGSGTPRRVMQSVVMSNVALALAWPTIFVLTSRLGVPYLFASLGVLCMLTSLRFVVSDRVIWRPSETNRLVRGHAPSRMVDIRGHELVEGRGGITKRTVHRARTNHSGSDPRFPERP